MKKLMMIFCAAAMTLSMSAAPAKAKAAKVDPVAEGFTVWQGATDKNFLWGRFLCPSDLRHRVVILVEVDASLNVQSTFAQLGPLFYKATIDREVNWAELEKIQRDVLFVVSNRGPSKSKENMLTALKYKGDNREINQTLSYFRSFSTAYDGLYLENAPERTSTNFPYVWVMGPDGTEPLFHGECTAGNIKLAAAAVDKGRKALKAKGEWQMFYGFLPEESKYREMIAKNLVPGKLKPLKPVSEKILKNVVSKNADEAKEAQMAFDAIEQARSDSVFRIMQEAMSAPHRAQYDYSRVVKLWPSEKKKFDEVMAKVKQIPEANSLTTLFMKMMTWGEPDFVPKNESDVKKIIAELNKLKKSVEKLKESKSLPVQNGALMMDARIDELISDMPSRVPEK